MRRLHMCAAAGLLGVAGAVLGAGTAGADSPSVSFTGGCGVMGLGARSQPNVSEVSVPEMGSVRFVNGMSSKANLVLPGGKRYTVEAGNALDVTIASGPAEAVMEPACGLGLLPTYRKVTINVDPPTPADAETQTGSTGQPAANTSTPKNRPSAAASPTATSSPKVSSTVAGVPVAGSVLGGPDQPNLGLTSGMTVAEPVAAGRVPDRASSLLAMVAVVCVVGVAAAAGRAITSQRKVRAAIA